MDKDQRFICKLVLNGPFSVHSVTPPDSDFLAAVVKGMDLRDFRITGLDTLFLRIEAKGTDAASRLEGSFRRHFTWGYVYQESDQ